MRDTILTRFDELNMWRTTEETQKHYTHDVIANLRDAVKGVASRGDSENGKSHAA